jgi:hypothetical protein
MERFDSLTFDKIAWCVFKRVFQVMLDYGNSLCKSILSITTNKCTECQDSIGLLPTTLAENDEIMKLSHMF